MGGRRGKGKEIVGVVESLTKEKWCQKWNNNTKLLLDNSINSQQIAKVPMEFIMHHNYYIT